VQQYARQAEQLYGARGCELLPPFDAVAYLQQVFLPRWRAGSTLADIGRVEELAEAMRVDYEALVGPSPGGVQTEFDAARLQFWQTIARIEQQGAQDRLRIMEQSRRKIGAIVDHTYARRQASLDRQFERRSQALRGVETFVDPATNTRVELSHGYQDAWANGLGDYVLSDSPGFDPGRELGGNWRALVRE